MLAASAHRLTEPSHPIGARRVFGPIASWVLSALVFHAARLVFHGYDQAAWWENSFLALQSARTLLLLQDLAASDDPAESSSWVSLSIFPVIHALAVAANLMARLAGTEEAVITVTEALAGASWLTLSIPPARWRRAGTMLTRTLGSGLVIGMTATVLMPAIARLWDGLSVPGTTLLTRWTFGMAQSLLRLVEMDVVVHGESFEIGARGFVVTISPLCSGVQGLGLVSVFLAGYLVAFRRSLRFPHALCLLPLGILASMVLNVVRIASLILIGAHGRPDIAVNGFHSHAGWLAFNAIAVGAAAVGRTRWLASREQGSHAEEPDQTTSASLIPLLALIAASLLSAALSSGFDWLYGLRLAAVGAVAWHYRAFYRTLPWTVGWHAPVIGTVVFGLWMFLVRMAPAASGEAIGATLARSAPAVAVVWMVLRVLGSTMVAPFAEELAFRAYLPRRLLSVDADRVLLGVYTPVTLLASSLAFGFLHGRWFAGTIAGLLYAWALQRRGSLGDAFAAHATTNGLLCVYALVMQDWSVM